MTEALFLKKSIRKANYIGKKNGEKTMSEAVQTALPWIVCGISAAILIPGIIDFFRKKGKGHTDKGKDEQNSWMMEGIGIGMLAGYWVGKTLGNAVLGLALGVLIGMFLGSKIKKYK